MKKSWLCDEWRWLSGALYPLPQLRLCSRLWNSICCSHTYSVRPYSANVVDAIVNQIIARQTHVHPNAPWEMRCQLKAAAAIFAIVYQHSYQICKQIFLIEPLLFHSIINSWKFLWNTTVVSVIYLKFLENAINCGPIELWVPQFTEPIEASATSMLANIEMTSEGMDDHQKTYQHDACSNVSCGAYTNEQYVYKCALLFMLLTLLTIRKDVSIRILAPNGIIHLCSWLCSGWPHRKFIRNQRNERNIHTITGTYTQINANVAYKITLLLKISQPIIT